MASAIVALRIQPRGGHVARRLVIRILSLVGALCVGAGVRAAEPLRFNVDGGKERIDLRANDITTWEENRERVLLLRDQIVFQTSTDLVRADRAVVWIPIEKKKAHVQTRGVIYLEGNVTIVGENRQKRTVDQVLIQFATNSELRTTGKSRTDQNLAEIPFYHAAVTIRHAPPTPPAPPERTRAEVKAPPERPRVEVKAPPDTSGPIRTVQATIPPRLDPVPSGPRGGEPPLFETPTVPLPPVSMRKLKIGNRSANPTFAKYMNMPNGEQIALITGGIKLLAVFPERGYEILDVEADDVVVWQKGGKASELVEAMRDNEGVTQGNDRETELFLSGNVIIRFGAAVDPRLPDGSLAEEKVMRADRVYYDVNRNKAIALDADIEMVRRGIAEPAHFRSRVINQLSLQEFQSEQSDVAASVLPADPELNLRIRNITITEEKEQIRRTIFGMPFIDRTTGEQDVGSIRRFKARNTFIEISGLPVMWFPYLAGDVNDPTGPLQALNYRHDSIFGNQFYTTWSLLELLGIKKLPGERWDLLADYLSRRGGAIGTVYDVKGDKLFGIDAPFKTYLLAYGVDDKGTDILGGPRQNAWVPPGWRGRVQFRHVQDYENLSFQGQVSYLSDRNFLEQYYKYSFDAGPNEETFAYLKYQQGIGAASILAEPNFERRWVTESQWLPNVQGYWLGQSFFDRITYNTWGSAAYANLTTFNLPNNELPSTVNPATVPTEAPIQTGRLDWMQQASVPFSLGALRIVPYVTTDLAYYTKDLNGDAQGRAYGGIGARASMPLSKLYEDAESELLNIHGIYHKMTFAGNYYSAWSNTPSNILPQLDRFNDDATQQSVRDMTPWQQTYVPGAAGNMLFNAPLYSPYAIYSPQQYALRRLVDTRVDALDTVQVVQAEIRQRWQTKRGYPGAEHTVDYITLDLSGSYFPAPDRDNFGHTAAFLEYNATWAVGDNNGFISSGWIDPFAFGTRYWNVAAYFTRFDGTAFNIAYRSFEPVHSRLVSATITYVFSPKYSASYTTAYDFGITNNQSNQLSLMRRGTDLTWSVGFSYNALLNNFGFNFMVIPNLLAQRATLMPGNNFLSSQNSAAYGRQ
jgi:hypothetical protein